MTLSEARITVVDLYTNVRVRISPETNLSSFPLTDELCATRPRPLCLMELGLPDGHLGTVLRSVVC